ncbi:MAG: hypothetical protein JXA90_02440 [Planctomycetes bacterium]|nr:hypothetical protein [Planctomycetota bacterium]
MADTIESFVARLQAEGVQAGEEQAEKLRAEARAQAEELVRKAEEEAAKIVAGAQAEAERILARSRTELDLAARDAVFKLREALSRVLEGLLRAQVAEQLSSEEFLKTLIREVISRYAAADREGKSALQLNLPDNLRSSLGSWVVAELQGAEAGKQGGVDVRGTLRQAGFEVRTSGGTLEVTVESVVETLKEMVGAALKERLESALKEAGR